MNKRALSLILAVMMLLAMAAPAYADGDDGETVRLVHVDELWSRYSYSYEFVYEGDSTLPIEIRYSSDPSTTFTYDEGGRLLSRSDEYDSAGGNMDCVYDEEGRLIEQTSVNSSIDITETYSYIYDGELLVREVYKRSGAAETSREIEYIYDDDGLLIEETEIYEHNGFGATSNFKDTTEYTYDSNGMLIEETWTMESYTEGTMTESNYAYEYEFNDDGLVTHRDLYRDGELSSTTEYAYDDAGLLTNRDLYRDGEQVSSLEYTYDSDGQLIREVSCYAGEDPETTLYLSDGHLKFVYDDSRFTATLIDNADNELMSWSARLTAAPELTFDESGRPTRVVLSEDFDETELVVTYIYTYEPVA